MERLMETPMETPMETLMENATLGDRMEIRTEKLRREKNEKKESESLTYGGNGVRDLGKTGACVGEFKTTP